MIVERAMDLRSEKPELHGVKLFRAAMSALPSHRRRRIVAMTQVPWFEDDLAAEIKRRKQQEHPIPVVVQRNDGEMVALLARLAEGQEKFLQWTSEWEQKQNELHRVIYEELRKQTEILRALRIGPSGSGSPPRVAKSVEGRLGVPLKSNPHGDGC